MVGKDSIELLIGELIQAEVYGLPARIARLCNCRVHGFYYLLLGGLSVFDGSGATEIEGVVAVAGFCEVGSALVAAVALGPVEPKMYDAMMEARTLRKNVRM